MSASLIGPFWVKRFQTIHPTVSMSLTGSRFFSDRHQCPSIIGFEDEGINPMGGLAVNGSQVQADTRSHLIHRPARTSFHRSVELECPHGFHAAAVACSRVQRELGAVNPVCGA